MPFVKVVGTLSPMQLLTMMSCSGNMIVRVGGTCAQLAIFAYRKQQVRAKAIKNECVLLPLAHIGTT